MKSRTWKRVLCIRMMVIVLRRVRAVTDNSGAESRLTIRGRGGMNIISIAASNGILIREN